MPRAGLGRAGARAARGTEAGLAHAGVVFVAVILALGVALVLVATRGGRRAPSDLGQSAHGEPVPTAAGGRRPLGPQPSAERGEGAGSTAESLRSDASPAAEDNNRAVALLGEGRLAEAVVLFESARAADPANDVVRENLAEARVRLAVADHAAGRLDEALAGLASALELAPERAEGLAALRARWGAERDTEADFVREGSDLFELSYAAERDDLLHDSQRVLDHLEESYERLRGWFGRDPVREALRGRIRVVLQDAGDFHRVTGLGTWAGGAFDGTVRVAVGDLDRDEASWKRTTAHELVHAFLDALAGRAVPTWLSEGLAQLLADPDAGPALAHADRALGTDFLPLARLAEPFASWSDADEIRAAYAESLLLVGVIRREYGDVTLRRLVEGCAAGRPVAEAFEQAAGVPLEFALGLVRQR